MNMNSLLMLFIFVPILVIILLALNLLLAVHRPDSEKVSPYECGFTPIYGGGGIYTKCIALFNF